MGMEQVQAGTPVGGDAAGQTQARVLRTAHRRARLMFIVPFLVPFIGVVIVLQALGLLALGGYSAFEYGEAFFNWRVVLVVLGLAACAAVVYLGMVSTLRTCQSYYRQLLPAVRAGLVQALQSTPPYYVSGQVLGRTPTPGRLLDIIQRQFIKSCRAQRLPWLPGSLVFRYNQVGIALLLIAVLLGLGALVYQIHQQALLLQSSGIPVASDWSAILIRVAGEAFFVCVPAIAIVISVAAGAATISLYRVTLEDREILDALEH